MASNTTSVQQLKQAETDIAVLQVRFTNLDEKIDEIKGELADIRDDMEENAKNTTNLIKDFQKDNVDAHNSMSKKIQALEKWRWMIMGAGIVIGALGLETLSALFQLG
jgi:anion-transporting  ArsA/GET3 family ATPase